MFRLSQLFLILVVLLSLTLASASTAFAHKHRICRFNLVHSLVRVVLMKSLYSRFSFLFCFCLPLPLLLLPLCQLRQRYSFATCLCLNALNSIPFIFPLDLFLFFLSPPDENILWADILSAFLFGFIFSKLVHLIHCVPISQMLTKMTLRLITKSKHKPRCQFTLNNAFVSLETLRMRSTNWS